MRRITITEPVSLVGTMKYVDMKHYKNLFIRNRLFLSSLLFITYLILFSSCSKDIDGKIEDCYNANDTIINLYDLYPEEWDTVYFFGSCSAEDIANRIGPVIYNLWGDLGDKMLILNKKKEVIYYKEWDMYYGQSLEGALFRFSNDSNMIAIPREKTKFLIRKRDEKSFWVIHQE